MHLRRSICRDEAILMKYFVCNKDVFLQMRIYHSPRKKTVNIVDGSDIVRVRALSRVLLEVHSKARN